MLKKRPMTLAVHFALGSLVSGLAANTLAATAKVDINADVRHAVINPETNVEFDQFERHKRITIHASAQENDFFGNSDELEYILDLDVHFGRDTGIHNYYFGQTKGDPARFSNADREQPFPWGLMDEYSRENLSEQAGIFHWATNNKYADRSHIYQDNSKSLILGSQPHPSYPNWSVYNHFGGSLGTEDAWRPRTLEESANWSAQYLNEFFVSKKGDFNYMQPPEYYEVINEPDMFTNFRSVEGTLTSWDQLFEYHSVTAKAIRDVMGSNAPKVGGMTWGLHDLNKRDLTATGAPRTNVAEEIVRTFFLNDNATEDTIRNTILNEVFGIAPYMDVPVAQDWYQWDVLWRGFMDTAGEDMDFYSIHLYDWPKWQNPGFSIRTGAHAEGVMDLLEWYDRGKRAQDGETKVHEVVVSEYGAVAGTYLENGTSLDRNRLRWEKLKPFSQMMMQFMERPDYVTYSIPFIVGKGAWGDFGPEQPYAQSLMDRDYQDPSCVTPYTDCKWVFNPAIRWYELWQDVKGTRIDTFATDRDIQVDAYVDNSNDEHHLYVILNSLQSAETDLDLSFTGQQGNPVNSVRVRHLYLDEGIDDHPFPGSGKPILGDAMLDAVPDFVTLAPQATMILDIEYQNPISLNQNNLERKYYAKPLGSAPSYRAPAANSAVNVEIDGVQLPTNGEAQLRLTIGLQNANNESQISLTPSERPDVASFKVNGTDVDYNGDWRGGDDGLVGDRQQMATLEIPVPLNLLRNGSNTFEFKHSLVLGEYAAAALQVWTHDTAITRSQTASGNGNVNLQNFNIVESGTVSLNNNASIALGQAFTPSNASNKKVTWESSNPIVASVDSNGIVTGNQTGTATIQATTVDGNLSDQVSVSVTATNVATIKITPEYVDLVAGQPYGLSAKVRPYWADNKALMWSSSNEAIATVDTDGNVTGHASGRVTIAVQSVDNPDARSEAAFNIHVFTVDNIKIAPTGAYIRSGGKTQLQSLIYPSNASNQAVTWTSSNLSAATVDANGLVSATGTGTTTITLQSAESGASDSVTLTIVDTDTVTPITIPAVNMARTGGPFSGFVVDESANGGSGEINNNQAGDWAEFDVNFAQSGVYMLEMSVGVPTDTSGTPNVYVDVDDARATSAELPITGAWDTYAYAQVSTNINIASAGETPIRLTSHGREWQWNLTEIRLTRLGECVNNCETESVEQPTPATVPDTSGGGNSSSSVSSSVSSVVSSSSLSSSSLSSSSLSSSSLISSSVTSISSVASSSSQVIESSSSAVVASSSSDDITSSSAPVVVISSSANSSLSNSSEVVGSSSSTASSTASTSSAGPVSSSSVASSSSQGMVDLVTQVEAEKRSVSNAVISRGATDVAVLKFALTSNVDGAQLNSLTIKAAGAIDDAADIRNVSLLDNNGDVISTDRYSVDNGTITFTLTSAITLSTTAQEFTVTYDFN